MGGQLDRLRVVALAGELLSYLPQPRQASQLLAAQSGPAPGRRVPCGPCGARGRVNVSRQPCAACEPRVGPKAPPPHRPRHGCVPCLVCGGTGWRPARKADKAHDEYVGEQLEEEREQTFQDLLGELRRGFGTKEGSRARELAAARQDALMAEWAYLRGEHSQAQEERWVREQRWLYRGGSYPELAAALDALRWAMPERARLWWRRFVLDEPIRIDAVAAVALVETTDWLLQRMPRPIVVPARLEPENANEARKESLWRGKTQGHRAQRAERDRHIAALRVEGWSLARIGRLYRLDRSRVKRILDRQLKGAET